MSGTAPKTLCSNISPNFLMKGPTTITIVTIAAVTNSSNATYGIDQTPSSRSRVTSKYPPTAATANPIYKTPQRRRLRRVLAGPVRMMRRLWRSPKRIRPMELGWSQPSPRASWVSLLTEAGTADHAAPIGFCSDAWSGTTSPTRILPGETADELWHMDMTKVWTAQHGWVYLHAIVDCCTRELVAWSLDVRGRTVEALACVDTAMIRRSVARDRLTIGTDNGTQFTSRPFRSRLVEHGIVHRRGGYRDPEQAFIESWFGRFKKRVAWRAEWETIDQARRDIANYVNEYHRRPHSGLAYRTPAEVAHHLADTQQPSDLETDNQSGVHVTVALAR